MGTGDERIEHSREPAKSYVFTGLYNFRDNFYDKISPNFSIDFILDSSIDLR